MFIWTNENDSQHYGAAIELIALEWNGNFHQSFRKFFLSTTSFFLFYLIKYLICVITKSLHSYQIIG